MSLTSFPVKIDNNLELTLLDIEHAQEFFELIDKNRNYLREWLGWLDNIQSVSHIARFIDSAIKDYPDKKSLRAWIKLDKKIIGIIHLVEIDWMNKKGMIGIWIDEESVGKGLATKATNAFMNFAFNEWGLNRIEIRSATGNKASQAVPEKLNFRNEGVLRENEWLYDHFVDHVVFSKLKREF